jgi:hypothetical protein
VKAEIRMMFLKPDDAADYTLAINMVRLSRGKIHGVDHNKGLDWSAAQSASGGDLSELGDGSVPPSRGPRVATGRFERERHARPPKGVAAGDSRSASMRPSVDSCRAVGTAAQALAKFLQSHCFLEEVERHRPFGNAILDARFCGFGCMARS